MKLIIRLDSLVVQVVNTVDSQQEFLQCITRPVQKMSESGVIVRCMEDRHMRPRNIPLGKLYGQKRVPSQTELELLGLSLYSCNLKLNPLVCKQISLN